MTAVYITSVSEKAGKTLFCAGLGKNWLNKGKKTGYLRLQSADDKKNAETETDTVFMQRLLGLKDSQDAFLATPSNLKQAYTQMSREKDAVLIEGLPPADSGSLIETLSARVVVIHDYSKNISSLLPEYKRLGRRLLGVVINKVPLSKLSFVKEQAAIQMPPASGIQLLGIIPEDRLLYSMTIAGLAELFQGKILNNTEKSGELIENYMLGALVFDSGEEYFKRKKNKAVILKSERPDMQLAALQTSLRCMVISGPVPPIPAVTQLARIKKVPLISTSGEVMNLISTLEAAAARRKFNQEQKLPLLMNAFKGNLDLNLFDAILDPAVK